MPLFMPKSKLSPAWSRFCRSHDFVKFAIDFVSEVLRQCLELLHYETYTVSIVSLYSCKFQGNLSWSPCRKHSKSLPHSCCSISIRNHNSMFIIKTILIMENQFSIVMHSSMFWICRR